jgi:hypothetical protein
LQNGTEIRAKKNNIFLSHSLFSFSFSISLFIQSKALRSKRDWFSNVATILITNTYNIVAKPCLIYGLRGRIEMKISGEGNDCRILSFFLIHHFATVSAKHDVLHSGIDGGVAIEPFQVLFTILSKLSDKQGRIMVPGVYDKVEKLSEEELLQFSKIGITVEDYKASLGDTNIHLKGEEKKQRNTVSLSLILSLSLSLFYFFLTIGGDSIEKILQDRWASPSISFHGIVANDKNVVTGVIPNRVTCTVSIRTVPAQGFIIDFSTVFFFFDILSLSFFLSFFCR